MTSFSNSVIKLNEKGYRTLTDNEPKKGICQCGHFTVYFGNRVYCHACDSNTNKCRFCGISCVGLQCDNCIPLKCDNCNEIFTNKNSICVMDSRGHLYFACLNCLQIYPN